MKIPVLEQSVGIDAPQVPETRVPGVVPGAFGGDVGASIEKAGDAGGKLASVIQNHIYQQNYWNGQATIANKILNTKQTFQDFATSTEPMPVEGKFSNTSPLNPAANANGSSDIVTQPKGYLNRQGFNALGVTKEFAQNAAPVREQFLAEFKNDPRLLDQATRKFDEVQASYYDQVSKHEATQYRLGMNNQFNALTVADVRAASSAIDPQSLMAGIKAIKTSTTQQYSYKGAEQEEIDNKIQDNVANAVSKAVVNKLSSTGDLTQAKAMLDSAKDTIAADRYEKIDEMLTTGHQRLQQQAHVATVQKTINGQASLLTEFASGKAGWMNIDDVSNLVREGVVSEKFGKAYSDVISSKGNYQPREESNDNVPKFIDAIYNAKDQTQLHDTLIKMMEEHKGMGQDEMAILINSAMKRSGSLPLNMKLTGKSNPDPKQQAIDAGAMAVTNFGRRNNLSPEEISTMYGAYYNNASKGMGVPQAMDHATKQYAISKYPAIATMDGTPQAVLSPESKVKYLNFSNDVIVAPSRIVDSKGVASVNTNRSKTSGGNKK